MKTLLVTVSLALAVGGTAQAQMFRPTVGGSAAVGAIAGGLIGGHNGDRWAEGAVIGGIAGAVIGAAVAPQEPVYQSPPPVYQAPTYGQQVYGQPGGYTQSAPVVVQAAPMVSNAPMVPAAPQVGDYAPAQVVSAPPQVVYVESAPRVVYVPVEPRVIYAAPPVIGFGFGFRSGPGYYGYDRYPSHGGYYGRDYRRDYGHRR